MGILRYVIGPSSGWATPSVADIKAGKLASGADATASGWVSAPDQSQTFDWPTLATGLTGGVAYRVAFVWTDGVQDSAVAVSDEFTTTAAGAVSGTASISLAALTSSASGTVNLAGAAAITLGTLTSSAAGTVSGGTGINGSASITLAAATSSAAGTVLVAGAASTTLGALTVQAAGAVAVAGSASVTLGAATTQAAGAVAVKGAATITLGAATVSATGALSQAVTGDAAITLGAMTSSAAGEVRRHIAPTSDVAAGAWQASSGTDLYAMIDESTPSGADYIFTQSASTAQVALGSIPPPIAGGHTVSYEIRGDGAAGLTVRLKMGATVIASWTHAPAPATDTRYDQSLTGGEIASITDYSNLRLEFEATV